MSHEVLGEPHLKAPGRLLLAAGALCLAAVLPACPEPEPVRKVDLRSTLPKGRPADRPTDPAVVRFGFDPRLDPLEEARIYEPLLAYLERKTGRSFELRFTKNNENIVENLGRGAVQFAAIGSVSHVKARETYGARCLVRGLNLEGKAEYRSAIVAPNGAAAGGLEGLRGRSFAFGDENSTQGHLIPRMMLLEAGVGLADLRRHTFTGSHQKTAEAVVSGMYDAGGMQDTLALEYARRNLLQILEMSRYYPSSGISSAPDTDPALEAAVRQALLDFQPTGRDRQGLYHWERTEMPQGFVDARESDYRDVREAMLRLGLLEARGGPRP